MYRERACKGANMLASESPPCTEREREKEKEETKGLV